ncbi:MAG TPA: ECF transporter S component [Candidatus Bathyarchaeia archaeon]|nr:ECF transporter S component [Candidatus Bathyarchaeia archaeon]
MNSRKVAIITVLAALSIATNYALLPFFNVKFMDFIVFVGGFCFGPFAGGFIGAVSWAIYGSLNPLGFSLPVWLSTMFAEAIFGVVGGFTARFLVLPKNSSVNKDKIGTCILFGVVSMLLTFAYDFITNIAYAYAYDINLIVAIIVGFIPFGIVHLLSNVVFFSVGCVPTINTILKITGGEKSGHE